MAVKIYTSRAKGLKLKVSNFDWLIPIVIKVTRENWLGAFLATHIANRVKSSYTEGLSEIIYCEGLKSFNFPARNNSLESKISRCTNSLKIFNEFSNKKTIDAT